MLTIKQLAERLAISRSLAYRMVQAGEIPSYRIGTCRRISEEQLTAYLERTRLETKPELPKAKGKHF